MARESGIECPADGMRSLLQLVNAYGEDALWTTYMYMSLEDQYVMVSDGGTGEIMERFPASWVDSPTAFTSLSELYNNVLALVVGAAPEDEGAWTAGSLPSEGSVRSAGGLSSAEGGAEGQATRSVLHFFQCHDVSAEALVEKLNVLKRLTGDGADD